MENETIKAIIEQLKKDFPDYTFIAYDRKEATRQQYPPQIFTMEK